jgi:hypothetical protein
MNDEVIGCEECESTGRITAPNGTSAECSNCGGTGLAPSGFEKRFVGEAQDPEPDNGTIQEGEYHPAADSAMAYVRHWAISDPTRLLMTQESFASTALSGNRLAEICHETLRRMMDGEPVSDRYLLGLAWTIRDMEAKVDGE